MRFHRLLTVPRPPAAADGPDPAPAQLFAALIAAHADLTCAAEDGAVDPPAIAVAWLRVPGDPHLRVLVGGTPTFPPARPATAGVPLAGTIPAPDAPTPGVAGWSSPVPVLYPPGSTGVAVDTGEVVTAMAGFPHWLRCAGTADALWAADRSGVTGRDPDSGPTRHGSFDDFAAHLPGAFAWLVIAQPVPADVVDAERGDLVRMIPFLRRREQDGHARLELERAEARYRELTRSSAAGLWDVRVLVGASTATEARLTAALLCGSGELDDLPYLISAQRTRPVSLAEALEPLDLPGSAGGSGPPPRALGIGRPDHGQAPDAGPAASGRPGTDGHTGPHGPTTSGYGVHGHPGSAIGADYWPGTEPGGGASGGGVGGTGARGSPQRATGPVATRLRPSRPARTARSGWPRAICRAARAATGAAPGWRGHRRRRGTLSVSGRRRTGGGAGSAAPA
ncbi:hypothetical protein [Candidatus Frankia nodulisporulans]|uniref:hypothetical protein n=1 Tax=Candidatus Frankia nodulisporulans TaxID=2060052 RepID=UPI001CDCD683|nr:hypothetical protein [Candidatus Frankia nodulisporulans]